MDDSLRTALDNDAIPAFLRLTPADAACLHAYGPILAERARLFAEHFYAWLGREPVLAEYLSGHDLNRLTSGQEQHYRQLLLSRYDAKRRESIHQLGRLHHRIGIPLQWLVAVYTLYSEHLDAEVTTLELEAATADLLRRALRKRVQLDAFWQQEGIQAAEREQVTTREAFYRAVSEANRLFLEAGKSDQIDAKTILTQLTEAIAREVGVPLVWIGLVPSGETQVEFVAAGGKAVEATYTPVVSIDPSIPEGNGPTGRAIRSGKVQIVENTATDPCFAPWRSVTVQHQLGGQGAAPFALANGQRGIVALYCRSGERFPEDLADLLSRLADDVGAFLDRCEEAGELLRMRRYKAALDAMQYNLLREPEPEAMYRRLAEVLIDHTDAAHAAIVPREGVTARIGTAAAGQSEPIFRARSEHLGQTLDPMRHIYVRQFAARVFQAGAPMILPLPHTDSELRETLPTNPPQAAAQSIGGWPIRRTGEADPEAVLVVDGIEPGYFTAALCDLLAQLTASVSLALTQHAHRLRIEQLSLRDSLTKLPNRAYFERMAEDAIARCRRTGERLAIGVLDLDRFKEWNDTLGHPRGDELLGSTAQSLRAITPVGDNLARLGGDEFGFQITLQTDELLDRFSKRALQAVAAVAHDEGRVTASLGWALYPEDGNDFSTLFAHADAALYAAKDAGRNTYKVFHNDLAEAVRQRFALRKTFPRAVSAGDIGFFLQPQADVVAGKLEGVELLVRWKSSDGWTSPAQFMPAIERDRELVRLLGRHALREAIRVREKLANDGLPLQVAVNVGANHFIHPAFLEDIAETLEAASAQGLTIEITETAALADMGRAREVMVALREHGFQLSLDDFGTGHASLHYAASLPVDELKLDHQFIRRFRANPRILAVVGAAVLLGELTERAVIAEGIETSEDCELWMRVGGRRVQGFQLATPLPEETFLAWAATWSPSQMQPVAPFPIEELPFLGQVFREPGGDGDCSDRVPVEDCPLSRWIDKRASAYARLPGWSRMRTVHQELHDLGPRMAGNAGGGRKETGPSFHEAVRHLYEQIDGTLARSG